MNFLCVGLYCFNNFKMILFLPLDFNSEQCFDVDTVWQLLKKSSFAINEGR